MSERKNFNGDNLGIHADLFDVSGGVWMRVKTGIPGLDELIKEGLPKGSLILLSGKCGTGKTTFSMQYIIKGITDYGEPGVFVSFERKPEALYKEMEGFGWHLKTLENQGNLELLGGPLDSIVKFGKKVGAKEEDMIEEIIEVVREKKAGRLALDGLGQFSMMFPDKLAFRSGLARLQQGLNEIGCTSIFTSEIEEGKEELSRLGVEEYVADGVIVLYYEGDGLTRTRALEIRKMRGTEHSNYLSFFEIADEGIKIVKPGGAPFLEKEPKKIEEKKEAISLEQAEKAAEHIVMQHMQEKVRSLMIETSDIRKIGDIPIFKVSGTVEYILKPGGFLRHEVMEERFWTVQIDARNGRILTCKMQP